MAENSKIEWTDHTFNPWRGCTKVSEGCRNCYAETMSARNPKVLGVWGPSGTRVVAAEAQWREPVKWNALAAAAGERHRVFCASLADVFEGPETMPAEAVRTVRDARARLLGLIARTPHLDWLLLTKRPGNVLPDLSNAWADLGRSDVNGTALVDGWLKGNPPANVWVGTSVENQAAADERIPHLLRAPARVRFLSCEPLLGPVDLTRLTWRGERVNPLDTAHDQAAPHIDWVIVGGESGPDARPMHPNWVRSLRDQCVTAGVAFFMKQWGEYGPEQSKPVLFTPVSSGIPMDEPTPMYRLGKKVTGRLLDGREWNELPTAEGERRCRECGINRPAGEPNCPVCLDAKTSKTEGP